MKKLFWCVCFGLFLIKVDAFEIGVWTDEIIKDSDIVVEATETRYRWYKNIIEYSPDYYIEGENDLQYPHMFDVDYIETEWSSWEAGLPETKANREIETWITGRYRLLRPIRYIFFNNVRGGFKIFKIAELKILINNTLTDVEMICTDCRPNFNIDVTDGLLTDVAYINNGGNLKIDLGDYYRINEVTIELYMYDNSPNIKRFDLHYNEGDSLLDRNYAQKEIVSYIRSANPLQPERYSIKPDSSFIVNPVFEEWVYIDGVLNTTYYRQSQYLTMGRYKDIRYKYYKLDRSYIEGYYIEHDDPDYIKDEESGKSFYLYRYKPIENDSNIVSSNKKDVSTKLFNKGQSKEKELLYLNQSDQVDLILPKSNDGEDLIIEEQKGNMSIGDITLDKAKIKNRRLLLMSGILLLLVIILINFRRHYLSHQK